MPAPQKGVAYTFTRTLLDLATPGKFRVNPTIAVGDFRLSQNNGTLVNLTNLPTVTPAGGVLVLFQLTAAEMDADRVSVVGIDQAGSEWGDYHEMLEPTLGWDEVIEGTVTARQSLRLLNAVLAGKLGGARTGTERMRDLADTKDRLVVTVDSMGNRAAIVYDLS